MAGKKYEAAKAKVDRSRIYNYKEGIALAKEIAPSKFDESVELSFFLNIDPRQADQNIRGAIVLPNGTGRTQKVLVITQGPKEQEARDAGADLVGGKDMLITRQRKIFAPRGFSFVQPSTAIVSPTDTQLATAARWTVVKDTAGTGYYDTKAIPFARIISEG